MQGARGWIRNKKHISILFICQIYYEPILLNIWRNECWLWEIQLELDLVTYEFYRVPSKLNILIDLWFIWVGNSNILLSIILNWQDIHVQHSTIYLS